MNARAARTSSRVGGSSTVAAGAVAITPTLPSGAIDQPLRLDPILHDAIAGRRCVFIAGLPGAGKSLLVHRAAALAAPLGRTVHLLQWDVARLAFDRPDILARLPEVAGVTHAAIRLAVGRWARSAVRAWHERHGAEHVLIGETPLVGERLASLARPAADAIEPLLASDATLFLVPVPSVEVRRAIEGARAREMDDPRHVRDRASAAPHLVRWHWDDLVRVGRELGLTGAADGSPYDPELYARVYGHLLRHRRSRAIPLREIIEVGGSVHGIRAASELVPTADEVDTALAAVEADAPADVERAARDWYRS